MKIGTWNLRFIFDKGTRLYSGVETEFTKEFAEKDSSILQNNLIYLISFILFFDDYL